MVTPFYFVFIVLLLSVKFNLQPKDLHNKFLKGEAAAFRELYRDYNALVFGIALRYTRCRDDAQDVLQETFIKVYENRSSFDPKYPFAPWVKRIAVNAALVYIRTNYKLVLVEDEMRFDQIQDRGVEKEDISEIKKRLFKVLSQLPEGYRIVFNLFVIDNLTHKEIATYLDISESTSRTQLFKAKKMISRILERDQV